MTTADLQRIVFALRNHVRAPRELEAAFARAFDAWLVDREGRMLDWHLALPARRRYHQAEHFPRRDEIYIRYAGSISGSGDYVARRIIEDVELWQAGELEPEEIGPAFELFAREWQQLAVPHVSPRSLRRMLKTVLG